MCAKGVVRDKATNPSRVCDVTLDLLFAIGSTATLMCFFGIPVTSAGGLLLQSVSRRPVMELTQWCGLTGETVGVVTGAG